MKSCISKVTLAKGDQTFLFHAITNLLFESMFRVHNWIQNLSWAEVNSTQALDSPQKLQILDSN